MQKVAKVVSVKVMVNVEFSIFWRDYSFALYFSVFLFSFSFSTVLW